LESEYLYFNDCLITGTFCIADLQIQCNDYAVKSEDLSNYTTIFTDKVSLVPLWHPAHCGVYSIQHYVIKLVSDLRQVGGFSPVSYTNNTNHHDITEIF
jgi:hypothetical protein